MSKLMLTGIAFVIAGIASGIYEKIFYGNRLDENNVVQESFFLPLSFMLTFLGIILLAASLISLSDHKGKDVVDCIEPYLSNLRNHLNACYTRNFRSNPPVWHLTTCAVCSVRNHACRRAVFGLGDSIYGRRQVDRLWDNLRRERHQVASCIGVGWVV